MNNDNDKPTYKQYDNPAEQWEEWKRQARALSFSEAKRHASVGTGNRHECRNCFCCAAAEVVQEVSTRYWCAQCSRWCAYLNEHGAQCRISGKSHDQLRRREVSQ